MFDTEALESAMIAELGLGKSPSTNNNLRLIQIAAPKLKNTLLRIANRYMELQRQFREEEITRPAANKIIRELYIPELLKDLPDEAFNPVKDSDNLNPFVTLTQDKSELERFKPTKEKLAQEIRTKGQVLAFAPVLPLCKPYLLKEKLNARGIKNISFEGYVVLEKQLVVGVSIDELNRKVNAYKDLLDGFDEIRKLGKEAKKIADKKDAGKYFAAIQNLRSVTLGIVTQLNSNAALTDLSAKLKSVKVVPTKPDSYENTIQTVWDIAKVIKELLDEFDGAVTMESLHASLIKSSSKILGKKLVSVGKPHTALGAEWLWLITEKELGYITSSSLGGHCAITKWGLAFSAS
jgi:hypothetical protein